MITVFRYENAKGGGPYKGYCPNCIVHPCVTQRRPVPRGYVAGRVRYAFESYSQLRRWWNPYERRLLKKAGFSLRRYMVPAEAVVYRDEFQVAVKLTAIRPRRRAA